MKFIGHTIDYLAMRQGTLTVGCVAVFILLTAGKTQLVKHFDFLRQLWRFMDLTSLLIFISISISISCNESSLSPHMIWCDERIHLGLKTTFIELIIVYCMRLSIHFLLSILFTCSHLWWVINLHDDDVPIMYPILASIIISKSLPPLTAMAFLIIQSYSPISLIQECLALLFSDRLRLCRSCRQLARHNWTVLNE